MKIALGTESKKKRELLEEALSQFGIDYTLEVFPVPSGVSDQPITRAETKRGSVNRAKRALKQSIDADIGVGIEVGYHRDRHGEYEMFCWATIIDNKDKITSAQSHSLILPAFYQDIIHKNLYLGDHVDTYLELQTTQIHQHVGVLIKERHEFIGTAIKSALIHYLNHSV